MTKTLDSATGQVRKVACVTTLSMTLALVLGVVAGLAAPKALAQDSSSSSSNSSGSQAQSATTAPGTAPMSRAAAAALAPYTGPKYDNRWELYGGLLYMNGQAGQNIPVRFNMGGGEGMITYWLNGRLGAAAAYRFGAGTTPVISPFYNRTLVMEHIGMAGVEVRGPKNRYVATNFLGLFGGGYGIYNYPVEHYPGGSPVSACAAQQQPGQVGNLHLYCNHWAPYGTAGSNIDFNQSHNLAVRLQPTLIFDHFGTNTKYFFAISLGVLWRFGHR